MAAREREVGAFIVIERRRNPLLGIMAALARRLSCLRKLACVHVLMARLALLRRSFELHFLRPHRHLMASPALHRAVRAE